MRLIKRLKVLVVVALTMVVVACGGGGGSTASTVIAGLLDSFGNAVDASLASFGIDPTAAVDAFTGGGDSGGDGSAGDGPPIVSGTVIITDMAGKTATAVTNAQGYYRAKITGFTAPLVVKVVAQNGKTYMSMREDPIAAGKFYTVNITSFTDKIASDVAVAAGKSAAYELTPSIVASNTATVAAAKTNLLAILGAALSSAGVTTATFDFVKTPFVPNGTGQDAVLDQVRHEVTPTGPTVLYAKAPTTDAVTGVDTSTPLSVTNTLAPVVDSALTFARLQNIQSILNACAALPNASRDSATPQGAACRGWIRQDFVHNSMDGGEYFNQISGYKRYNSIIDNRDLLLNAQFEIPEVLALFSSTNTADMDVAVTEFRWYQPVDSSYRSAVFQLKRFPGYVRVNEGNQVSRIGADWWAYGDQRPYDASIGTRLRAFKNLNPATQIASPSVNRTHLTVGFNSYLFNRLSQLWESANVNAVRVTGPGLPAVGLTLTQVSQAPGTHCAAGADTVGTAPWGASYMGTYSTTMATFPNLGTVSSRGPHFVLKQTDPVTGTLIANPTNNPGFASPAVTDLSPLAAWNVYTFTVQKNDLSTVTFTARNIAAVMEPDALRTLPLHDFSVSDPIVTAPQGTATSVTVNWVNNPAMPGATGAWVNSSYGVGFGNQEINQVTHYFPKNRTSVQSANSQTFNATELSYWPGCGLSGTIMSVVTPLETNNLNNSYREVQLGTTYNRVRIDQYRYWKN